MVLGQLFASELKILTSKKVLSKTVPQRPLPFMSRRASSVAVEFLSNVSPSRSCSYGSTATSRQPHSSSSQMCPLFHCGEQLCSRFRAVQGMIVVINLLNRSFQGFDAGVAVDTPDRLIPIFTSRYCHSTIGIAVVLSVLA